MERKVGDGLVLREKPEGGFYPYIYFKKMYRGHRLRGSSKTDDPEEAARRLRRLLNEIDNQQVYGIRPKRCFKEGVEKLFKDLSDNPNKNSLRPKTILNYGQQADFLVPRIGDKVLPIWKEDLNEVIKEILDSGCSVRTVNLRIEFVRLINRKACYSWRDESTKSSWIDHCPILSMEKGSRAKAVPLSWDQQDLFFDLLSGIKRKASLVAVNTGLRDRPLINLNWSWEVFCPALKETVFQIPGEYMKNGKEMTLMLNRIARREIESLRGRHQSLVFGPIGNMTDKAWYRAWKASGLPTGREWKKGVHNLRHTFGKRLRDAGVDERDVKDLLHHLPKDVTRVYSAPDLCRLKDCLERLVPVSTLKLAQN